jgi:hypothetical protein
MGKFVVGWALHESWPERLLTCLCMVDKKTCLTVLTEIFVYLNPSRVFLVSISLLLYLHFLLFSDTQFFTEFSSKLSSKWLLQFSNLFKACHLTMASWPRLLSPQMLPGTVEADMEAVYQGRRPEDEDTA